MITHETGFAPGSMGREGVQRLALSIALTSLVALGALVFPAHAAARIDFPLDDAWIHLVYVRALITDASLAYNPGQAEAGFSSPLWLLLLTGPLALCRALQVSPVVAVKLVSLACAACAAASVGGVSRRLGASRASAAMVCALVLLGSGLAEAAPSGMEVALNLALLSAGCAAVLDGAPLRAGCWLALALWARPESALATLGLAGLLLREQPDRAGWRAALQVALPSLVPGALWCAYNQWVTGHPLPNTFYAKTGRVDLLDNVTTLARTFTEGGMARAALVLLLLALGAQQVRPRRTALRVALPWLLPLLGVLLSRHLVPGAGFCVRRYLIAFLPLGYAFLGPGLDAARARAARLPRYAAPIGLLALCASLLPGLAYARWQHGFNCKDIRLFHTGLAHYVRQSTPADAVVAVEGAGASRYFSERVVVDVLGLNHHEVVHARGRRMAYGCTLASLAPTVMVLPVELSAALSRVFVLRRVYGVEDARYTQAVPPQPHRVDVFEARVREDYRARCVARFGGVGRPPSSRAPSTGRASAP